MAKKFLVALLTLAILFVSIAAIPVIKADTELQPDIITDKIIFVSSDSQLISTLQKGTLGIVTFNSGSYLGFDVPGGNIGTDIIVTINNPISVSLTNPVGLVLKNGKLEIYLSESVRIISLPWNDLSISEIKQSWFPQYINAEVVKLVETGAWESEKNYCCNPPITRISYFYKIYLTSEIDPYNPPVKSNIEIGIMIPDYLVDTIKALAANQDCIWIGVNGDYQIYLWLSP